MNFAFLNSFQVKILALLLSLSLFACKKRAADEHILCPTCHDEECQDFQWPIPINFETFTTSGPQFTAPFYNPNNLDEFIYVKTLGLNSQLIKHVISSGEETILYDGDYIIGQPQWGATDWIIFSKSIGQNNLMKVRADGTGLEQISKVGSSCIRLSFCDSGTRICASMSNYVLYGYLPIIDLEGNLVDSINTLFGDNQIGFPKSVIESVDNGYYCYFDVSTSIYGYCKLNNRVSITNLFTVEGYPKDMCKNNNGIFYVQFQEGLFVYDFFAHQTRKLISNCESKYINWISMSPDGNSILYEKVTGVQTGFEQQIDQQSEIYRINVKTKEKTGIILE